MAIVHRVPYIHKDAPAYAILGDRFVASPAFFPPGLTTVPQGTKKSKIWEAVFGVWASTKYDGVYKQDRQGKLMLSKPLKVRELTGFRRIPGIARVKWPH